MQADRGAFVLGNLATIEVKAFVPARDFELSKRFYQDLGFDMAWSSDVMAYFCHGDLSFLLQKFYVKEHAVNTFMMHLLVEDVDAWWKYVVNRGIAAKYGIRANPPEDRSWGLRDFILVDPTGVLWRIGQDVPASK